MEKDSKPLVQIRSIATVWYKDGNRHREDGPAIDIVGSGCYYALNDVVMTEIDFREKLKQINNLKQ